jgi:hypothetical protein
MATAFFLLATAFPLVATALPRGVPTPPLDLAASHLEYSGDQGYLDAGNGPYTHYVDNQAPNCSDDSNGSSDQPRCSLPLEVSAGAVIEVHGGPYDDRQYNGKSRNIWLRGSETRPVFLRGIPDSAGSPVTFRNTWFEVSGDHFVIESLKFLNTQLRVGEQRASSSVLIRGLEVTENEDRTGVRLSGANVVFLASHVHHNFGDDNHGIYVGRGSRSVWIVDNEFNHNTGDGVQFCHKCSDNPPRYVYIAGNNIHSNRENGVDLKYARNIVVSENRIYNHWKASKNVPWCFDDNSYCGVFSSGSDGSSIVVGSDGGPIDVVVAFNHVFNSNNGIRVEEGEEVLIATNVFHGIANHNVVFERTGGAVNVVHNTFSGGSTGVRVKSNVDYQISIANNVFTGMTEYLKINDKADADEIQLNHNLFWNDGEPLDVRWGDSSEVGSDQELNGLSGHPKTGNRIANPELITSGGRDWILGPNSEAVDGGNSVLIGLAAGVDSHFPNLPSVLRDFYGNPRGSCVMDIGAVESVCTANGTSSGPDPYSESEPEPEPDSDPGISPVEPEMGEPVVVDAWLHYDPDVAEDFVAVFPQAQDVSIPQALPVVSGQPGKKSFAKLELHNQDESLVCIYQGNGSSTKTNSPCSKPNGDSYQFSYCMNKLEFESGRCSRNPGRGACEKNGLGLTPNMQVSASGLAVSLLSGDSCDSTHIAMEIQTGHSPSGPTSDQVDDPSEDQSDNPAEDQSNSPPEDPSENPEETSGVARAERFYKPNYSVDFNAEFAAPRSTYVPASLPVVQGQSGKNYAVFSFISGEEWKACFYLGNGKSRSSKSPCDNENGDSYIFDYCVDRATYEGKKCGNKPQKSSCFAERLSLSPYEYVDVESIGLSVQSGDSCGTTAIELDY